MPDKDFDEARWKEDSRIEFVPEVRGYYALGIVEAIYISTNPPRLCDTTIRERVRSHFTNKDQQRISQYLSGLDTWENIRIWWSETPRPCIEEKRLVTEYKMIHKGYMPEFNELRVWNPSKCPECSSIPPTPMAPHLTTWQWKRVPQCEASTDGQKDYEMIDSRRIPNKRGIYAIGRIILFRSELTPNVKQAMQEHLAGLPGSIVRIWWRRANPEMERPLQQAISRMTDSRHSLRISTISLSSNKGTGSKPTGLVIKNDHLRPPDNVLTMSRTSSVSSVDRKRQNSMPVRLKGGRVVEDEDGQIRGRQNSLPAHQRGRRSQRAVSESRGKSSKSEDELESKGKRTLSEHSLPDTRHKSSVTSERRDTENKRHSSTKTDSGESTDVGQPSLSHLLKAEVETINVASLLRPTSKDIPDSEPVPPVQKREDFISELRHAQRRLLGTSVLDEQNVQDDVFEKPSQLQIDNEKPSTSYGSPDRDSPPPIPSRTTKPAITPRKTTNANVLPLPERAHKKEEGGPDFIDRRVVEQIPMQTADRTSQDGPPPPRPPSLRNLKPPMKTTEKSQDRPPSMRDLKPPTMKTEHSSQSQAKSESVSSAASANGRVLGRRQLIKITTEPTKKVETAPPSRPDTPVSMRSMERSVTPESKHSDHSSKKGKNKQKPTKRQSEKVKQKPKSSHNDKRRPKSSHPPSLRGDNRSLASELDNDNRVLVQYKSKKTGRVETVDITDVQFRKRAILERREAERRAVERKAAEKTDFAERKREAKRLAEDREHEQKRQAIERKARRKQELERAKSVKQPKKSTTPQKPQSKPLPQNQGYELKTTHRSDKGCIIS